LDQQLGLFCREISYGNKKGDEKTMITKLAHPDEIEMAICQRLDSLVANPTSTEWSDTEWTKQVKSTVAALGKDRSYWVYCSGCSPSDGGEWLFDLCWLEYDGDILLSVPLIMECEWTPSEADDDFQKLIVAKADHRVMVFAVPTGKNRDEKFSSLLLHVNANKHSLGTDRYLLSCWDNENRGFDHRVYSIGGGVLHGTLPSIDS